LCEEGGVSGVTDVSGSALRCGNLQAARDLYAEAEIRAALTQRDVPEALAALRRAEWFGGGVSKRASLHALFHEQVKTREQRATRIEVTPLASAADGALSPLSFTDDETLLIQVADGVKSYRAGAVTDVTQEVDAWVLPVNGPQGQTWLGIGYACDGATLTLQAKDPAGTVFDLATTDMLAPRPGVCTGKPNFSAPSVAITGWNSLGFYALLDAQWITEPSSAGARGSALSPNGRNFVVQTALGIVAKREQDFELWRAAPQSPAPGEANAMGAPEPSLSSCVINNAASVVACVSGTSVVWLSD
jgi:hypothetical protein